MRLVDLDPGFLDHPQLGRMLMFSCPKCDGGHHVGAPVTVGVKLPNRWKISSEDFNTLTMEPSIRHRDNPLPGECLFHFNIVNGEVIDA